MLGVTHLGVLGLIAVWLAAVHPAATPAMVILFGAALLLQSLPAAAVAWSDRFWLRELASVGIGAGLYLLGSGCPLHPLLGMTLATVILIPARRACLRYVIALAAADLVTLGVLAGRTGTSGPVDPGIAAAVDGGLALIALAADSWHESGYGGRRLRRSSHWSAPWRWCLLPVLCALAGLGLTLITPAVRRLPSELNPQSPAAGRLEHQASGKGLQTQLHIGAVQSIERDQTVCARIAWDDPGLGNTTTIRPPPMIYLRALALSRLRLEGTFLAWAADTHDLTPLTCPIPANAQKGVVLRLPGGGDAVYQVDGCTGIELDNLQADAEGNRYRTLIGDRPVSYVVSLERLGDDEGPGPAPGTDLAGWRRLPNDLLTLPFADLIDPRWAGADPLKAAEAITTLLGSRCTYELNHLPDPAPGPGGTLRRFLFDDDPQQRRGHCQYFATALVVLMRLSGHASRCVVGFASEELDADGATFRGLHAHAWAEVIGRDGRWHRVDATPVSGFMLRSRDLDESLAEPPPRPVLPTTPTAVEPAPSRAVPLLAAATAIAFLLAGLATTWLWLRWRRRRASPLRRELDRRRDELLNLAADLGIKITPATTFSAVVEALSAKTGAQLEAPLRVHLAARYGNGPVPPPWPIAALRAAATQRASAKPKIRS